MGFFIYTSMVKYRIQKQFSIGKMLNLRTFFDTLTDGWQSLYLQGNPHCQMGKGGQQDTVFCILDWSNWILIQKKSRRCANINTIFSINWTVLYNPCFYLNYHQYPAKSIKVIQKYWIKTIIAILQFNRFESNFARLTYKTAILSMNWMVLPNLLYFNCR